MEVLYCDSFAHEKDGDHVDEVIFPVPVIVSACHIVPKDSNPEPEILEFQGLTSPAAFDLQVFYHNGDQSASHFVQLGPKLSWTLDGIKKAVDLQPVATRHLVFRGTYQNLSLIIYGATIPEGYPLTGGKVSEPSDALNSPASPSSVAPTPTGERLQYSALSPADARSASWHQLLLRAGEEWVELDRPLAGNWGMEQTLAQLADAANQVEAATLGPIYGERAEGPVGDTAGASAEMVSQGKDGSQESAVQLAVHWIAGGPTLAAGLCASLLACADAATCYRFVAYGGATLLADVLGSEGLSPAIKLRVLVCLSRVSGHGFGCEALLGWWLPETAPDAAGQEQAPKVADNGAKAEAMEVDGDRTRKHSGANGVLQDESRRRGPSKAYGAILSVLLTPQPRRVALLAAQLLKRLKLYELTADFNDLGRSIASDNENPPLRQTDASLRLAADLLQEIVGVLFERNTLLNEWPPQMASLASSTDLNDVPLRAETAEDSTLWVLLKDRQLLGTLAVILTSPAIRQSQGRAALAVAGLLNVVWSLMLPLLDTRPGLLFLAEQPIAVAGVIGALEGSAEKQERNSNLEHERAVPRRLFAVLLSLGAVDLCSGCQLARLLREGLHAVVLLDSILAAATVLQQNDFAGSGQIRRDALARALSAAKELSQLATSESSRQAVVAVLSFPEALPGLLHLQQSPRADASTPSSASLEVETSGSDASLLPHYIACLLLALLTDPSPAALAASAPQGLHIQAAVVEQGIKAASANPPTPDSDASVYPLAGTLSSWISPIVVWKKEGPLALLQLLASLTGLKKGPAAELGFNLQGYELAYSGEDADVGSMAKDDAERPLFVSAGTAANTTVALRLLASLAVHSAVSSAVYDGGGTEVLLRVFKQSALALEDLPTFFDLPGDHVEPGAVGELLESQQERRVLLVLLPALSLTALVLAQLQSSGIQYRSTPLVTSLLMLNSALSSRPAYTADMLKVSPSGNTLLLHAVRQGVACVAAFWAVDARWGPPLVPKLLSALPQEVGSASAEAPRAVLGIVQLLGDVLPAEYPPGPSHAHSLRVMLDSLPVLAMGSMRGPACSGVPTWGPQHGEKLAKALAPHVEQLGAALGRIVFTSCQPLQEALARLSSRVCSLGADHSQALSRHLYTPIQSAINDFVPDISASDEASPSERDAVGWRLVRGLHLLAFLAQSPPVKAGLQQLPVAVQMTALLQSAEGPPALLARLGMGALAVLQSLMNPAVCLTPQAPLQQRMVEATPPLEQSQEVAGALLGMVSSLHVKDGRVAAAVRVLGIMAGNDLGRNAIATVAWRPTDGTVSSDSGPANGRAESKGSFAVLWEALGSALGSSVKASGGAELAKLLILTAGVGLSVAKSHVGSRALQRLFHGSELQTGSVQQVVTLLEEVVQKRAGAAGKSVNKALTLCEALDKRVASMGAEPMTDSEAALTEAAAQSDAFEAARDPSEQFEEAAAARAARAKLEEGGARSLSRSAGASRAGLFGDGDWGRSLEGWVAFKEDGHLLTEQRAQDPAWAERVAWQYSADVVWPPTPRPRPKRKADGDATEGQAKKLKAGQMAAQAAAATLASRKDPFRARRQNTGRPPSMHVDDFMAQKGGTMAVAPQATGARVHTGGRAPSIRVDDFMKLESEKGRTVVGAPVHSTTEPGPVPFVASAATKPVIVRAVTAAVVRVPGQAAVVKARPDPARVVVSQGPQTVGKVEARAVSAPVRPPNVHPLEPAKPIHPAPLQQMVRPPMHSAYIPGAAPTPPSPTVRPPPTAWPKPLHEIAQAGERPTSEAAPPFAAQQSAAAGPQRQASFADPRRQAQGGAPAEVSPRGTPMPGADPRRGGPQQQLFDPRRAVAPQTEGSPGGDPRRAAMPASTSPGLVAASPLAQDPRRGAQGAQSMPGADPRRRADPRLVSRPDSFAAAASPPVPATQGWPQQPSAGGGMQGPRGPPGMHPGYGHSPPTPQFASPGVPSPHARPNPPQPSPRAAPPHGQPSHPMQPPGVQLQRPGMGGQGQSAQAGPSAPRPAAGNTTEMMGKLQDILKQPGFIQGLLKDKAKMGTFLAANPAIVPMLKNMLAQMGKKAS